MEVKIMDYFKSRKNIGAYQEDQELQDVNLNAKARITCIKFDLDINIFFNINTALVSR